MSQLGKTVKDIRIVDTLGRGGMGEVYVGFDEKLKRKVALKSIRSEQMRLPDVRARFLREARILSQLDHPNICRIYEYIEGEDSDFLVLELIRGTTLKRKMREDLDHREKLTIAAQIADVLVAAHAAGVVHRDLKPENVMLTEAGDVKVLDFGLAQSHELDTLSVVFDPATEPGLVAGTPRSPTGTVPGGARERPPRNPLHTEVGMVMGTPSYMSPEQSVGSAATAASDMYSFGLILQELFTEESAYEPGLTLDELLPRVRDGRTLPIEGVPKDIASLIGELKSVAPEARPSAAEAAERIRWIREKPRRMVRRGLVALVLLLAILGTAKYTFDLQRERARAVEARGQAEDLMTFMFEDLYQKLEPVGRLELLESVAQKAYDYYRGFSDDRAGTRDLYNRAIALREIGRILEKQGDLARAVDAYGNALAIHEALAVEAEDDPKVDVGRARTLESIGGVLEKQGDLAAAQVRYDEARALAQGLADRTEQPEHLLLLASIHASTGGALLTLGDLQGATEAYRQARSISQRLVDEAPGRDVYRESLARSWNGIGQAKLRQGRNEEALLAFQKEREENAALVAKEPANSLWRASLAEAWNNVGEIHQNLDQLDQALEASEQARAIIADLTVQDPTNAEWRYNLAKSHERVGKILKYQGRLEEAEADYERARQVMEELVARDETNAEWRNRNALVLVLLGEVVRDMGKPEAAREHWEEALRLVAPLTRDADDATESTFFLDTHAMALMFLERDEEARPLVEKLLEKGWSKKSFLELADRRGLL